MPVQSEHYCKVKPVCDRLAVLVAQCNYEVFEKRFHFLDAVCKSWSQSEDQQRDVLVPVSRDVCHANDEQMKVDMMTYSEEKVIAADDETLITDNGSRRPGSDCIQSQLDIYDIVTCSRCLH